RLLWLRRAAEEPAHDLRVLEVPQRGRVAGLVRNAEGDDAVAQRRVGRLQAGNQLTGGRT
ncbi:MAG TPA: hypothetical protein VLZ09_09860, partial [Gaiellaceae bacterium]|nr:hypothetical protein [Gaiellaceae bacterium]